MEDKPRNAIAYGSKHGQIDGISPCRSCGKEVAWVITFKSGKRMPVNPEDDTSHFATCPQADSWRREK